jgi:hypothetical protein
MKFSISGGSRTETLSQKGKRENGQIKGNDGFNKNYNTGVVQNLCFYDDGDTSSNPNLNSDLISNPEKPQV